MLCLFHLGAMAQNDAYKRYIAKYSDMAVSQMHRYGVPASVTLAQGLLESNAGMSRLARVGNNHFGIKCHNSWKGKYMLVNDDAPNERFRVYKNAAESYEDHSLFLKQGKRYSFLFKYSVTDYRSWAYGLKKAGYATNPSYARSLINIIEAYGLQKYDRKRHESRHERKDRVELERLQNRSNYEYVIHRCNDQYYVVAREGDTYASIAKKMKTKERKLRKYNDATQTTILQAGDPVYLGSKRKKAARSMNTKYHTLQDGESLYTIAQHYGIRLASLCSMNPLPTSGHFSVGDVIQIK